MPSLLRRESFDAKLSQYGSGQVLEPARGFLQVAYILHLNGIVGEQAVMNSKTLPRVRMPNRDGFVSDPRPDIKRK